MEKNTENQYPKVKLFFGKPMPGIATPIPHPRLPLGNSNSSNIQSAPEEQKSISKNNVTFKTSSSSAFGPP